MSLCGILAKRGTSANVGRQPNRLKTKPRTCPRKGGRDWVRLNYFLTFPKYIVAQLPKYRNPDGRPFRNHDQNELRVLLFVMVGLCGGFTTFSSFSLQTLDLLRSGATVRAAINIVASIALGVGAVALGHLIAGHFNGRDTQIAQISIEEEG
jgi:CrcB-like protein, Camphor Resistance (CrcB)